MKMAVIVFAMLIFANLLVGQIINQDSIEISVPAYLLVENNVKPLEIMAVQPVKLNEQQSYEAGVEAGSGWHDPIGFFMFGLIGGSAFGLPGAIGAYSVSAKHKPSVKTVPVNCLETEYRGGYLNRSQTNNVYSTLLGGTMGTALHVYLLYKLYKRSTNISFPLTIGK